MHGVFAPTERRVTLWPANRKSVLPVVYHVGVHVVVIVLISADKAALLDEIAAADVVGDIITEWPVKVSLVLAIAEILTASRSIETRDDIENDVCRSALNGFILLDDELNTLEVWFQLDVVTLVTGKRWRYLLGVVEETEASALQDDSVEPVVVGVIILEEIDRTGYFYNAAWIMETP